MTSKINGQVVNGEHLTSDMDFWTVYTVCALTAGANVNAAVPTAANNLDRVIQFIGNRAQAVMVSVASASVNNPNSLYSLGTDYDRSGTTVYTLKFATEHTGAWTDTAAQVNTLAEALDGLPMPFTTAAVPITGASTRNETAIETSSASAKNTAVVKSLTL
jgi:hypothetical protein